MKMNCIEKYLDEVYESSEEKEEDVCKLCGSPDRDLRSDHLRTCYKITQDELSNEMFKPRYISYEEMMILERGTNIICNDRSKCLKRQKSKK